MNVRHLTPYRSKDHKKVTALWVVAPCSLVEVYRRFEGAYCLHQHVYHYGQQSSEISCDKQMLNFKGCERAVISSGSLANREILSLCVLRKDGSAVLGIRPYNISPLRNSRIQSTHVRQQHLPNAWCYNAIILRTFLQTKSLSCDLSMTGHAM
jgi:hypothetical protein